MRIPEFKIETQIIPHCITGEPLTFLILTCTDGQFGGNLEFESVDHIFYLKEAVDTFISQNNLKLPYPMKKNNKSNNGKSKSQDEPIPGYCYILEGYLKGWAPAEAPGSGTILKTSQEIANDLEDMVEIDTRTVASIMSQFGFRTHYDIDGGPHGWMMRRDPAAVYTIRPASAEEDPEED